MWPGMLSPDSQTQYAMALSGLYNDHHPPLMSLVWGCLNQIIPGSGMMFLLHLALLYGAIFYLINSVNLSVSRFIFCLFPLIPQIFFYCNTICKDVGFAFSFLFVASYLSCLTSGKGRINWHQTIILLIILLYGTSVKFQAQYSAFILLGWIAYIISNYNLYCKQFIKTFSVLLFSFYLVLHCINYIFIPNVQKTYGWQFVKIYDIAAISLSVNQDLFPGFAKNKNFSMQELANKFNTQPVFNKINPNLGRFNHADLFKHHSVDNLVFVNDAILRKGVNEVERKELYLAWITAIVKHPLAYLKHRSINMISILIYPSGFKYINDFLTNNSVLYWMATVGVYLIMPNLIPTILSFIYFVFGIFALHKMGSVNRFAIPLVCFNAVGLSMVLVLFFCSMGWNLALYLHNHVHGTCFTHLCLSVF
jgi:hypothetical protein